MPEKFEHSA